MKTEDILKTTDTFQIFSASYKDFAIKAMQQCSIEFAVWVINNYHYVESSVSNGYVSKDYDVLVNGSDYHYENLLINYGHTIEELFTIWNNEVK